MGDQYGFGALHVRVGWHRCLACRLCLSQESLYPQMQIGLQCGNGVAHIEPQIGGNLLIPAAARVQLQRCIPNAQFQFQLDEVVDIFRIRVHKVGSEFLIAAEPARLKIRKDTVESTPNRPQFVVCEDAQFRQGARMRFAGGHFVRNQAPVKAERALPAIEIVSSGSRNLPDHIFTEGSPAASLSDSGYVRASQECE